MSTAGCAGGRWRARVATRRRACSATASRRSWSRCAACSSPPTTFRPSCAAKRPRSSPRTARCAAHPSRKDPLKSCPAGEAGARWKGPTDHGRRSKVAKIVVVTSGKGGVGKTTTSANIATGVALRGHKTIAIDFDVGLRNLDLVMGCERRVVYDLVNVTKGEAKLVQALIRDKRVDNLYVLPASQTRDKDALDF